MLSIIIIDNTSYLYTYLICHGINVKMLNNVIETPQSKNDDTVLENTQKFTQNETITEDLIPSTFAI